MDTRIEAEEGPRRVTDGPKLATNAVVTPAVATPCGPRTQTTSAVLMVVGHAVARPIGSPAPAVQVERPRRNTPGRPETTLIPVVVPELPTTRSPRGALVAREDRREHREPARRIDVPRRPDQAFPLAQGASVPPRISIPLTHRRPRIGSTGQTVHRAPARADLIEGMGDDPTRIGSHLQATTVDRRVPTDAEEPTRPRAKASSRPQRRGRRIAAQPRGLGPTRLAIQLLRGARSARPNDQTQAELRETRLRDG